MTAVDEPADSAGRPPSDAGFDVEVYAPQARSVRVLVDGLATPIDLAAAADGRYGSWFGTVPVDGRYRLQLDEGRLALDPRATEVWFPAGHRRAAHRDGTADPGLFPRAVARPWPPSQPSRRTSRPLLVYEAHVRGLTMRRDRPDAGTFRAAIDELPRLRRLGVSVLELLPVHQYDPDEGNYWGYMPVVFGAVHRQYAAGDRPADELAELVAAAHDHDIEVWVDVVLNHTSEGDRTGPDYTLRPLAEREYYVVRSDGTYVDEAGTGNIVDANSPPLRRLVMEALDRLADLGIDGFRFDLAAVLARDPDFVRAIGDWADRRGVRLVAEPWDMARYLLGPDFPDPRWAQWNGEYRDDVRGFLRGEPGLVPAVMRRIAGSPDLFERAELSINFLTAHDGFTMYDLVAYDHRHNLANGEDNEDGHRDNRSWNSGWEGDVGVPGDVLALRHQRLRSAMALLLFSRGTPMFVAGDEAGRTQHGNNNAYNQDNEVSWLDWDRAGEYEWMEAFVQRLIALRAQHPGIVDERGGPLTFHGAAGEPDTAFESRSLAWHVDGLFVAANMWWHPVRFQLPEPGEWQVAVDTSSSTGVREPFGAVGDAVWVPGRTVIALTR